MIPLNFIQLIIFFCSVNINEIIHDYAIWAIKDPECEENGLSFLNPSCTDSKLEYVWFQDDQYLLLQQVFAWLNLLMTVIQIGLNLYQIRGMNGLTYFTRFWNIVEVLFVVLNAYLSYF